MIISLTGRTALVTGSTAGIGYAIAEGLARAGAHTIINGRTQPRVQAALAALRQILPDAQLTGIAADVATAQGCAALLAAAPTPDILVNNAGTARPKPFLQQTEEEWLSLLQLNLISGMRLSQACLPAMMAQGWGRIVFISSESGLNIPKEMIDYGITKTAQLALSRGLAELAAGTGVTINAILPGPTRSEGVGNWMAQAAAAQNITQEAAEQQFLTQYRPTTLLGRFATPEEVANMVTYICSPQAAATTGAALRADGGVLRSIA